MPDHPRRRSRWRAPRRLLYVLVTLVAAWLLFGYYLVNPLARSLLPWFGRHELDSILDVGDVRFDPLRFDLTVDRLLLARPNGRPLFRLQRLHARLEAGALLHGLWHLPIVELDSPEVYYHVDRKGRSNWDPLVRAWLRKHPPAAGRKPGAPPRLQVDRFRLHGGLLAIREGGAQPLDVRLQPLDLGVNGLRTTPGPAARYRLTGRIAPIGIQLDWTGSVQITPLESRGRLDLSRINLPALMQVVHLKLPVRLEQATGALSLPYRFAMPHGRPEFSLRQASLRTRQIVVGLPAASPIAARQLDLADLTAQTDLQLRFLPTPEVQVSGLSVRGGDLRLSTAGTGKPLAELQSITLNDGRIDPAHRRATFGTLRLSGLQARLIRERDRRINWLAPSSARTTSEPAQTSAGDPAAVSPKAALSPSWNLQLAHLRIDDLQLDAQDRTSGKPVRLDVSNGRLLADNLSLDTSRPVRLTASLDVRQGGHLEASGALTPATLSGKFLLDVRALSLLPFDPYLRQVARLKLHDGQVNSHGTLLVGPRRKTFPLRYDGGFSVDRLSIKEQDTGNDFLGWQKLSSRTLHFSLAPDDLRIGELDARAPFVKVVIFADHTLNLDRIRRGWRPPATRAAGAQTAHEGPRATSASEKPAPQHPLFPLLIRRLRVFDGSAYYADLSLPTPFGTRMHNMNGTISNLSTRREGVALIQLDGQVNRYGSASVRGAIQPFRASNLTHVRLQFRNLEMADLTPYSAKFAGRRIDSGRMSATLEYRVRHQQLQGDNVFVIHKIKLGQRVDSKDALNLPLNLAIALLEDQNGIIHLDLPVSGNLDDPKFSYGRVIWAAVVNVLTKIVTAPFHALASLLGLHESQIEALRFPFGQSAVPPPEQEILHKLAGALAQRPQLVLRILPGWQDTGDTQALRQLRLRQQVATAIGLRYAPGTDPGPIDPASPRTRRVLQAMYDKRFASTGGFDGLKKSLGRTEIWKVYLAAIEHLESAIPITPEQLAALAAARGAAVRNQLVNVEKVPAARVEIAPPRTNDRDREMADSKIELRASGRR
ncbi:MAG: DUF748 domain-containing protein [Betaproteobacteria bacterium]|nr:DUF748 domain-containing protein [Betaproteobacteria bacterium]